MTESRRVWGGEFGGGDRGFDDAEVATAKATAAVDVLLLYITPSDNNDLTKKRWTNYINITYYNNKFK